MSQLALPLVWPAAEGERDFLVSDANRIAVRHLDRWGTWPVMATLLTGPRKSGRSLLGRIFANKSGGQLIDDADARDEELLFHAWNRAQERRRPLLIIADAAPPAWVIALPDLRSRLAATPVVSIAEPDDALSVALLERLIGQRGLRAPPEVVGFLARRVERSYVGLGHAIDALDEHAFARRQGLTVPLARRALIAAGVIDE